MSLKHDIINVKGELITNPYDYNPKMKTGKTLTCALIGDKGTGKTLFMAIWGVIFDYCKKDFYTNFSMNKIIKHRKEFSIRALYSNPNVEAIFLDELHNLTDQNSNNSPLTKLLKTIFTQSRKRNQLILLGALRYSMIAIDLRRMIQILIFPHYDEDKDILNLFFWNIRNGKTWEKKLFNVSRFFGFYDTHEVILDENTKRIFANYLLSEEKIKSQARKELSEEDKKILEKLGD